jgi:hypothetical protein
VQYWVKVVFADNQELLVKDAIRHTISEDMEVLEVDSAKEVIIVPMKQIKYIACDALYSLKNQRLRSFRRRWSRFWSRFQNRFLTNPAYRPLADSRLELDAHRCHR